MAVRPPTNPISLILGNTKEGLLLLSASIRTNLAEIGLLPYDSEDRGPLESSTIDKINQASLAVLSAVAEPKALTLLAQATIFQSIPVVRVLLERKVDPLTEDKVGWTPLHYALTSKNPGLFDLFAPFLKGRKVPRLNEIFYALKKHIAPIHLAPDRFEEIAGAKYEPFPIITPSGLMMHWTIQFNQNDPRPYSSLIFRGKYEKLLGNAPRLELKANGNGIIQTYALENIEKGDAILVPAGEFSPIHISSTLPNHVIGNVYTSHYQNHGSFIRYGFPNCKFTPIESSKLRFPLLVATMDIKSGAPLRRGYSVDDESLSWLPPCPEEQQDILSYFTNHPFDPEDVRTRYVASSPHALALLALKTDLPLLSLVDIDTLFQKNILLYLSLLHQIKKIIPKDQINPFLKFIYELPCPLVSRAMEPFGKNGISSNPESFDQLFKSAIENFGIYAFMVRFIRGQESDYDTMICLRNLDAPNYFSDVKSFFIKFEISVETADLPTRRKIASLKALYYLRMYLYDSELYRGEAIVSLIPLTDEEFIAIQPRIRHRKEVLNSKICVETIFTRARAIREALHQWIDDQNYLFPFAEIFEGLSEDEKIIIADALVLLIDRKTPYLRESFLLTHALYHYDQWSINGECLLPDSLISAYQALKKGNKISFMNARKASQTMKKFLVSLSREISEEKKE